ncbi:hypothetical protein E2320_014170 [Naja naja]|nr:hypothetical protein E2320_014170 [Naja naja]
MTVGEQDDRVILGFKAKNLFELLSRVCLMVVSMRRSHHVQNNVGTWEAKSHTLAHFCSNSLVWTMAKARRINNHNLPAVQLHLLLLACFCY